MASFVKAKELYNQGKFQEAYEVYLELQSIYGHEMVSYNLKKCQEKFISHSDKDSNAVKYEENMQTSYSTANTSKYRIIFSTFWE